MMVYRKKIITYPYTCTCLDHSIWYKWLLLTHHDDPSGEAKVIIHFVQCIIYNSEQGFLKASFSVLGPDDDNIVPPSASHPDNVDIELYAIDIHNKY